MTARQPLAFVVDDEPAMLDIVTFALETQGFEAQPFTNGEAAWAALERRRPDLVVLDVMLPGASGLTLCRRIKERWSLPVMLVTAKGETQDRIVGLEAQADDYVAKPFHPRELALRAQRLVRRTEPDATTRVGELVLDAPGHAVTVGADRVVLTANEVKLLSVLMTRPDEAIDHRRLLLLGWGDPDRLGGREMVKAAIYRMRHKLEAASPGSGTLIESVRGSGYRLRSSR